MRPEFYVLALWLARETADRTRIQFWADKYGFSAGKLAAMMATYTELDRGHRLTPSMAETAHTRPLYAICKGLTQCSLKRMIAQLAAEQAAT